MMKTISGRMTSRHCFIINLMCSLGRQRPCPSVRSVSSSADIDPAVYYAHLAGNRAKVRDESLDADDSATSVSANLRRLSLDEIPIPPLKRMHANLNGGALAMWYL